MLDFGIGERFGLLAIAAALLFVAVRGHKAAKSTKGKVFAVITAFLAGCATLVTFVGDWMGALAMKAPGVTVAGLIVCVAVIIIDVAFDKKPDGFAFWAAFCLALFIVFGAVGLPATGEQIGRGAERVGESLDRQLNAGGGR